MNKRKFGRTQAHREAMIKNLCTSLIRYGKIKTTISKAKEVRSYAEKVITLIKKKYNCDVDRKLDFSRKLGQKVFSAGTLAEHFKKIASITSERNGGCISIKRIGHTVNDNSVIAVVSIIGYVGSNSANELAAAANDDV